MANLRTIIFGPESLELGAVVPQALDIHYVSDAVLELMLREHRDYRDPKIIRLREHDSRLEYRRSLLYARQVILNRAFFYNPLVYQDFEERADNETSRAAFRILLETGVIIPFLFKKSGFFEDLAPLSASTAQKQAAESLPNLVSELRCLKLHPEDGLNAHAADQVDQSFRVFIAALGQLHDDGRLLNALASQVYRNKEMSVEELKAFGAALQAVSEFAGHTRVDRTVLYNHFLIADDVHDRGRFKSIEENPFLIAQKKLFDLRYATALPDMLGRHALTPRGLPNHAAVDLVVPAMKLPRQGMDTLLAELTRRIQTSFLSSANAACFSPALADLSIEDILEIRSLEEWRVYDEMQGRILAAPLEVLEYIERFSVALSNLQQAIDRWHRRKYRAADREARYVSMVSVGIQVLGVTFAAFAEGLQPLQQAIVGTIPLVIPKATYGCVVRLLIDFLDIRTRRIDPTLSFSVDVLRSDIELDREDIALLIDRFRSSKLLVANSGAPNQPT